jgi:hypothetical protein
MVCRYSPALMRVMAMDRLTSILTMLGREGKIEFDDMHAIYAAVAFAYDCVTDNDKMEAEFKSKYGTLGLGGLHRLLGTEVISHEGN